MRIHRNDETTTIVGTRSSITVQAGVREDAPSYPTHLLKALNMVLGST